MYGAQGGWIVEELKGASTASMAGVGRLIAEPCRSP